MVYRYIFCIVWFILMIIAILCLVFGCDFNIRSNKSEEEDPTPTGSYPILFKDGELSDDTEAKWKIIIKDNWEE